MNWRRNLVVLVAVMAMVTPLLAGGPSTGIRPTVQYPVKSDVLPALRDVPIPQANPFEPREVPNRPDARMSTPGESANVQTAPGAPNTPDPLVGWPGLNSDDNNTILGGRLEPPDTQGDVGVTHYIQWINSLFAVYDKTGAKVFPTGATRAVAGSILWAGFGGPCQNDNDGDPITLWDPLAQRWVMSQFAVSTNYGTGPYYQCVAVSATADPTGAWNRYAYSWPGSRFPDYPKLGVWNDAYYITTNDFNAGLTAFMGVTVGAFDRANMLAGTPAGLVSFQLDPNIDYSMLPADLDGLNAPPAGSPGLFGEFQDSTWIPGGTSDQIWLYEFDVDWTNPANSTFGVGASHTPNYQMDITNVSEQCTSRACVPMPAGGENVDSIDFRTMYRLAYRNNTVGGEMMVTSMTVAGGGKAGIWWGEFHKSGGAWDTYQDGVYSPSDTTWRFMPSIAQDTNGNVMLGYSASSSTLYPSVWYVGRLAGDALGTMGDEKIMAVGSATKTSGYNRWGDYSMMSIDPVDDCSFWYTQEYLTTGGSFQFQTYIGSMKFPSCSTGPTGIVQGTVLSTAGGAPIQGAQVQVGAYATSTNASGFYTITVPVDTYSVTASKFGFGPQTVTDVVVGTGATVTQDFNLTPVGTYWVDGFVTAAEHLWPLWAKIDIKTGTTVVGTFYTSPWNGYYEVELANGFTYDFTVHSMYTGYVDEVRPVTVASASQTQNFTLLAASGNPAYTCILQGGINEQFEGTFPPAGWTVKNNGSAPNNIWKRNDVWGRANLTGGTGFAASADSDKAGSGSGPFNTELWSPPIVMPAAPRNLVFKSAYYSYSGQTGTLGVSTDGGTTWTTLLTVTVSAVAEQTINLTPYASQTIILRWTFVSPSWAYYWQIDDVRTQTIPVAPAAVLSEAFEGTVPPTGWTQVDSTVPPSGVIWKTNVAWARTPNPVPGGTGNSAGCDVDKAGSGKTFDCSLITSAFDVTSLTVPTLGLKLNYNDNSTTANRDFFDIDASSDGGTTWTNVVHYAADTTGPVSLNLTGKVTGTNNKLRFRYYTVDLLAHWDWYAYIDDVAVTGPPPPVVVDTPTLVCSAVQGSMVAGFVTDENTSNGIVGADVVRDLGGATQTMVATGNLPAGFYYMFSAKPDVTAPEGPSTRKFTASKDGYGTVEHLVNLIPDTVNRLDFALPAASLALGDWPFVIDGRLTPDGLPAWDKTDMFSILNSGGLPADVKLNAMSISSTFRHRWPAFVPETPAEPIKHSIGRAPNAPVLSNRTRHPELAGALAAIPAFGMDVYPGGNMVTWPDSSAPGTWTVIAPEAATYFAGDFLNGDFSKMYVLADTANMLHTVDTATGAVTVIGPSAPEAGESWTGLKGSSDGKVYASATTCSASTLYTIDPATGAVTKVGPITNGGCVIDIAINKDGEIYAVDLVSANLLEIDPATGAGTIVGPLGAAPNYAQGMDFEEESGILYWAAYIASGELRTIDTDTGASFLIGAFPGGAEVDAFAIASGGSGGGLPWFVLTPTEGTVPADGQLDIDAEFFPEGVAPAHYGLFRAVIKSTNDTPAALPDIPVYFTKAFWDVPRGHWADQFIHALAGVRITKGCGAGNFCPEANINRADMAILMVRAIHGPDFAPPPAVGIFVDVVISDTDTTADYIEQLYNDGVVAGCAVGLGGERYYCPADLVNRAQMAVFVAAGLEIDPVDPPTGYFTDVHGTGYAWAEGYVEAIFNEGITAGCGTNLFCPADNITRAQLAVWLTVALDLPTYLHPMAP